MLPAIGVLVVMAPELAGACDWSIGALAPEEAGGVPVLVL